MSAPNFTITPTGGYGERGQTPFVLPNATVGQPYSQRFDFESADPSREIIGATILSNQLDGLSLVVGPVVNTSYGGKITYATLSGTPANPGSGVSFTLQLGFRDNSPSYAETGFYSLTTAANQPRPVITSATSAAATVNSPFSYTITASGAPTGYDARPLPVGLSLNGNVISGTPTQPGTSNIALKAGNAAGEGTATLVLTVSAAPPGGGGGGSPTAIPVVSASGPLSGQVGQAFSFFWSATQSPTAYHAAGLPAGLQANTNNPAIYGTPTQAGTFQITFTADNSLGTSAPVTVTLTIQGPPTPGPAPVITSDLVEQIYVGQSFSYAISATNDPNGYGATGLPTGIVRYANMLSGAATTAGVYTIGLTASNAGGTSPVADLVLTVLDPPPPPPPAAVITSALTAAGEVGVAFSYTITADHAVSVGAGVLPDGLAIAGAVISGVPVATGLFPIGITATNSAADTVSATLELTVTDPGDGTGGSGGTTVSGLKITSPLTASPVLGTRWVYRTTATGHPTSFDAKNLPDGINRSLAELSGTFADAGTYHVQIIAAHGTDAVSEDLVVTVADADADCDLAVDPTTGGVTLPGAKPATPTVPVSISLGGQTVYEGTADGTATKTVPALRVKYGDTLSLATAFRCDCCGGQLSPPGQARIDTLVFGVKEVGRRDGAVLLSAGAFSPATPGSTVRFRLLIAVVDPRLEHSLYLLDDGTEVEYEAELRYQVDGRTQTTATFRVIVERPVLDPNASAGSVFNPGSGDGNAGPSATFAFPLPLAGTVVAGAVFGYHRAFGQGEQILGVQVALQTPDLALPLTIELTDVDGNALAAPPITLAAGQGLTSLSFTPPLAVAAGGAVRARVAAYAGDTAEFLTVVLIGLPNA